MKKYTEYTTEEEKVYIASKDEYEWVNKYFKREVTQTRDYFQTIKKYVPLPLIILGGLGMASFGAYESVTAAKIQTTISAKESEIKDLKDSRTTMLDNKPAFSVSDYTKLIQEPKYIQLHTDITEAINQNKKIKLDKVTHTALAVSMVLFGVIGGIVLSCTAYTIADNIHGKKLYKETKSDWTKATQSAYNLYNGHK